MRPAPHVGQRFLVGQQVFDVPSVRGGNRAVKLLGRSKIAKHPCPQRSRRQVISPLLDVPTRLVGLVAPRMQQISVDKHPRPLPAVGNLTSGDLPVNSHFRRQSSPYRVPRS